MIGHEGADILQGLMASLAVYLKVTAVDDPDAEAAAQGAEGLEEAEA